MSVTKSFLKMGLVLTSITCATNVFADETFEQDGHTYVLKPGEVGVMTMPNKDQLPGKNKQKLSGQKNLNGTFNIYRKQDLKMKGSVLADKQKYQVVYKQVQNPYTKTVKEVPALLSGQVIVKAKEGTTDAFHVNTSLKLKKKYEDSGIYIYEIVEGQSVSQALKELREQDGVKDAKVEVVEHLRIPM